MPALFRYYRLDHQLMRRLGLRLTTGPDHRLSRPHGHLPGAHRHPLHGITTHSHRRLWRRRRRIPYSVDYDIEDQVFKLFATWSFLVIVGQECQGYTAYPLPPCLKLRKASSQPGMIWCAPTTNLNGCIARDPSYWIGIPFRWESQFASIPDGYLLAGVHLGTVPGVWTT
jgi:hypothetical protein